MHTSSRSHTSHAHARPLALFPRPPPYPPPCSHDTHARMFARTDAHPIALVPPSPYGSDLAVFAPVPDPTSPDGSPRPHSTHTDPPTFALIGPVPSRMSGTNAATGTRPAHTPGCPYGCRPRPRCMSRTDVPRPTRTEPTLSRSSHPLPAHTSPSDISSASPTSTPTTTTVSSFIRRFDCFTDFLHLFHPLYTHPRHPPTSARPPILRACPECAPYVFLSFLLLAVIVV